MPPKTDSSSTKSPEAQQRTEKWHLKTGRNIATCCRRFALWLMAVFVRRKAYLPGDTNRFIWQTSPEIKRSFVYYRLCHMLGNLTVFCISFFHFFIPYKKDLCETIPTVLCLGQFGRVQFEWFMYATSLGVTFNVVQSVWGMVLTLTMYLRQKKTQNASKGVSNIPKSESKAPASPNLSGRSDKGRQSSVGKEGSSLMALSSRGVESKKDAKNPQNLEVNSKNKDLNSAENASPSAAKEHKLFSKTGFYWGLHTYSLCSSILIDIVYWNLIWPHLSTSPTPYFHQFNEHGLNLPLMITDFALVAFPILPSHLWFTTVISFGYVLLNFIWYAAGGQNEDHTKHYIYTFLDWQKPGTALTFGVFIAIGLSVFMLIFLVVDFYKFKCRPEVNFNSEKKV